MSRQERSMIWLEICRLTIQEVKEKKAEAAAMANSETITRRLDLAAKFGGA